MSDIKAYITNDKEMNRRKIAFLSLELSLLITISACFYNYIIISPLIAVLVILVCLIIMLFIYSKVSIMLDKQKKYEFYINNNELERQLLEIKETYDINDIESIRVKRTSKKSIREINFNLKNNETIFINGLNADDFKLFLDNILEINKNIIIKEFNEPIDLDHALFYPILGIICGVITSVIFKLMLNINEDTYTIIKNIASSLIIIIGIFWFIKKPTSRTYGKNIVYKDIIVSIVFVIVGLLMLLFLNY